MDLVGPGFAARDNGAIFGLNSDASNGFAFFDDFGDASDGSAGKKIVTVGPSSTERYLSTPLAEKLREEVSGLTAESFE